MPLTFIHGTMNSGKSAQLLCKLYHDRRNGKRCFTMKPGIDTRDGTGIIHTRIDGLSTVADFTFEPSIRLDLEASHVQNPFDYLYVDECQFMTIVQAEELVRFGIAHDNVQIYCYGLLSDFQPKLFGASRILLLWADRVVEIESKCVYCDRNAKFNLKLQADSSVTNEIDLGSEDKYAGVCKHCFNEIRSKQMPQWEKSLDFIFDFQFNEMKIN